MTAFLWISAIFLNLLVIVTGIGNVIDVFKYPRR